MKAAPPLKLVWKTFRHDNGKWVEWLGVCQSPKLTAAGETYAELVASIKSATPMGAVELIKVGGIEELFS